MPLLKFRRQLLATGGVKLKGTGLTMEGTGRVRKQLWIPATDWYGIEPNQFANAYNATVTAAGSTPSVCPVGVAFGSAAGSTVQIPALSASVAENKDARAATVFMAPTDADTTGSVSVDLVYTTQVAMATTGSMNVFRLHYNYTGDSGEGVGGTSGSILKGASMTTVGGGKWEVENLGTMPSFQYTASPIVMLQLTDEGSSASYQSGSSENSILGLRLTYTACALGTASNE